MYKQITAHHSWGKDGGRITGVMGTATTISTNHNTASISSSSVDPPPMAASTLPIVVVTQLSRTEVAKKCRIKTLTTKETWQHRGDRLGILRDVTGRTQTSPAGQGVKEAIKAGLGAAELPCPLSLLWVPGEIPVQQIRLTLLSLIYVLLADCTFINSQLSSPNSDKVRREKIKLLLLSPRVPSMGQEKSQAVS
ncbi:uncharacterized protein LOC130291329 isoform X2 [Hyla sarda]|uniref:uncharacterized protein LOC130291329 isoform X2 n=1 Tax=Hyla sarda TaxID=327740 RepID=UPI0024C34EC1|nr:uncharacterized protein LOC130291329 isoform X2 [Hyla sarda]XP_056395965.1 uncharacterized protein LOC130291329 isoform X2 [Hyla sarda]